MPSRKIEDDFILTISDNEDLPVSDAELDSSEQLVLSAGKKRKLNSDKSENLANGRQHKRSRVAQPDEEESEEDEGVQDGVIDPDFEFDLGSNVINDTIENFDGWGDENKHTNGDKKGVDIDEIIARRAAKQEGRSGLTLDTQSSSEVSDTDQSEMEVGSEDNAKVAESDSQEGGEIVDFEDDELLAEDAFGANADFEDEKDQQASNSDDDEPASDDDSIASPTAHPDDLASDNDDDDSTSQTSIDDIAESAKRAAFFGTESQAESTTNTSSSFQQFSLSRPILRAVAALSFNKPTPIQSRTIPIALQGLDVVGSAVTGSGKTAAFLLPILERLLYRPRKIPTTRVVILMPTRELAVQCYNVAVALARYTDVTFAQVVGGFSLREQEVVLRKRPDVVIATPGRFIDHMRNSASFTVENIEILVLDEADRMLEDGFADELDEILRTIPKGRQTMLFSATMTETVDKLVRVGMNRPIRVSVDAKKSTVSGLIQEFVRLRPGREEMRLATLCVLCTKVFQERTIIFFRQKKEAHRVRIVFGLLGIKAGELHGSMSQEQRITAVNNFREGKTTHLLATDLASRGLDIKNVMSVINYEAPQSHEIYLHRVGRTARAGRSGRACTIAAEPDRKVVKAAVKSGRTQDAKIVSRTMDQQEVDSMHTQVEELANEIDEIMQEEKEEKAMAQAETQITRGENLVKHEAEIMSRPKRTWFESEKDKKLAKDRGKAELNSASNTSGLKFSGEKKKLSNKDKKKLDDRRERVEGRSWKKGKGDSEAVVKARREKKRGDKDKKSSGGGGGSEGRGGGGGGRGGKKGGKPSNKGKFKPRR